MNGIVSMKWEKQGCLRSLSGMMGTPCMSGLEGHSGPPSGRWFGSICWCLGE